jgi:hypothetical protein
VYVGCARSLATNGGDGVVPRYRSCSTTLLSQSGADHVITWWMLCPVLPSTGSRNEGIDGGLLPTQSHDAFALNRLVTTATGMLW